MAKKPPVNVPLNTFESPDTRAWCIDGFDLWIVRASEKEPPVVVSVRRGLCYEHSRSECGCKTPDRCEGLQGCHCKTLDRCQHAKQVECKHLRIALAEHRRLFAIYGEYIPDSETILLDAVDRAWTKIVPVIEEEDIA
jgi:hypothetical protein